MEPALYVVVSTKILFFEGHARYGATRLIHRFAIGLFVDHHAYCSPGNSGVMLRLENIYGRKLILCQLKRSLRLSFCSRYNVGLQLPVSNTVLLTTRQPMLILLQPPPAQEA